MAKNYNHLPSCAGLKKTTWNTKALNLTKKDVFYILLLHNTSCSSWKHKTCYYLHLLSSSLCFCTHDNVAYISDIWLLYALERLTSALDVNALRWCEMSSEFYIFSILFDLRSGIQIVKYKASFTAFSKIPVRDYLYMLTSYVYIQMQWSGRNYFNIFLKYKNGGFWSLPERMDFSWLRSPGSLWDRFNCYIRVCVLIFYIWCAKVQGRQSGTVQMPLCKMFSDSLHLSDMVILALHQ